MSTQYDIQQAILETIENVIKKEISDTPYLESNIGKVVSVSGADCEVEFMGEILNVRMFDHLRGRISANDLVVMHNVHNHPFKRYISAKIGEANGSV